MEKRISVSIFILCVAMMTLVFSLPPRAAAQQAQTRPEPTLLLWPEGAPHAIGNTAADKPSITVFLPKKANGTAVLVCPGGGYAMEAMDKEGYQVAEWLNSLGVTAFVLKYRHGNRYQHPAPMNDAKRGMKLIRSKAKKWNINPDKLGILGFSAGGHLASTVGTHWDKQTINRTNPLAEISTRPDFMILIYPVISMKKGLTHQGSRTMLLGSQPSADLVNLLSNEEQVTNKTPPTFLAHGSNDQAVPVQNSLAFYRSLTTHEVPAEMHLFEDGPHGFGLAKDDQELSAWTTLCENWMRSRDLLPE